ncbi:MAG: M48 family metalloprotease [Nitrospirae bacterium]|nr:M48 family metalloprotease [Nitrospirota bacterium]
MKSSEYKLLSIVAALCAIVLVALGHSPAIAASEVKVSNAGVPVRSGPGAFYDAVGFTKAGDRFKVTEDDGRWMRVEGALSGFLSKKALENPSGASASARYSAGESKGFGGKVSSTASTAATRGLVPVEPSLMRVASQRGYDVDALQQLELPPFTPKEAEAFEKTFPRSAVAKHKGGAFYFAPGERDTGRGVALQLLAKFPPDGSPSLRKYVALVGLHVQNHTGFYDERFTYIVAKTDTVLSFALPGGYVIVSTGAIRAMRNEAELAFVLAHEISHIALRHGLKEMKVQKERIDTSEAMDALDVELDKLGRDKGDEKVQAELSAMIDDMYAGLVKGRLQAYEFEADEQGAALAASAGYPPGASVEFLERISGATTAYASHPSEAVRVERLNTVVKSPGAKKKADDRRARFAENAGGAR